MIHQAKIYHSCMKHCLRNRWITSVNDQFIIRMLVWKITKTQLWLKIKKNLQKSIWSLSLLIWTSEEDESNNSWTKHLYFIIQHDISEILMCHSTHLLMLLHHDHESSWDWKCWWHQTSCWFILVEFHTT